VYTGWLRRNMRLVSQCTGRLSDPELALPVLNSLVEANRGQKG